MINPIQIRDAEVSDLPGILEIFNWEVRERTAAWTNQQENLEQRRVWFETRKSQEMPVLVAVKDNEVLGFASFGAFHAREGYRLTVEHTVYVKPAAQRQGLGEALLQRLIDIAIKKELHVMVGLIDGENKGSIALHQKLGFDIAGNLPEVGTKFGRWLDLVLVTKALGPMEPPKA